MTGHVAEGNPETRLASIEQRLAGLEGAPKPGAAKTQTPETYVTAIQLTDALEDVLKEVSNIAGDIGRLVERITKLETTLTAPAPKATPAPKKV